MARFPVIQRMCPYRNSLAEIMDGDVCRLCRRQVHDLTAMSDRERQAFLDSCADEVCVSYSLPIRRSAAVAALSAAMIAVPVAAEESGPRVSPHHAPNRVEQTRADATDAAVDDDVELMFIIVGGIKDRSRLEYIDADADAETPALPVIYEDDEG